MAGYRDTRQLIIDTLTGRPAGTEIQPEEHQAFALALNDYIRSVELSSGSVLMGIAESNTVPVEPDNSRVAYIASVSQNTVYTFTYFKKENGEPIAITTTDSSAFVILLWNTQYWDYQILPISVLENNSFVGYFECASLSTDVNKTISSEINQLTTNLRILVKMNNVNTQDNATLQMGLTDAKPLYYNGLRVSSTNSWAQNEVLDIYYNGTNYVAATYNRAQFRTGEEVGNVGIDDEPTANSNNLVTSGGIHNEISRIDSNISSIENDIKGVSENYVEDTSLIKNKSISSDGSIINASNGRLLIIPTDNNSSFLIQDDGSHGYIIQWGFLASTSSTTLLNSAQTWLSDGTLHNVDIPQGAGAVAITLANVSGVNTHVGFVGFPLINSTGSKIIQLQTDVTELQTNLDKKKFVSNVDINAIFETNMIQNEFFKSSSIWRLSNATISNNKLKFSGGKGWGYQTLTLQENHKYLIVCYAKLISNNNSLSTSERYVFLNANGIGFVGSNEGLTQINHCCGYLPIIGIYDSGAVTSKSFSFGIIRQDQDTQETGEISHAGVYDITNFSDTTYDEFYYAYKSYIESKLGIERLDDKIIYPDTLAKITFVNEMNSFAKEYGMNNTIFYNPSGLYITNTSVGGDNNISTSADLCKMCASLLYNSKLLRVGNIRCSSEEPFVVSVLGKNARTISITSGIGSLAIETTLGGRFVFGGKGGSFSNMPGMSGVSTNYVILVKDKETDKNIVASFMKFDNVGGQSSSSQLKIIIDAVLNGETTLSDYAPAYAAGGVVPSGDPSAFKNLDFLTLSKDKDTQYEPFSTTKLMTFIVACEYGNMSDLITIYASDFQGGSGTQMQDGDILTLRDALAVMMMESNNTIATAVSRFIGQKILQAKYK